MRLLITASRKLKPEHYPELARLIAEHYPNATEIWHGGATGGDQLAKRYAQEHGLKEVELKPYYGNNGGRLAPLWRNDTLVANTHATLAAYWGTLEGGTAYTAKKSMKMGHQTTIADLWTGMNWTNAAK